MKIFFKLFFLTCFLGTTAKSFALPEGIYDAQDSIEVNKLNKEGYANRVTNPKQTLIYAQKALEIANRIGYENGIAEAYRVKGIGMVYQSQIDSAISNYFKSLEVFSKANNQAGVAKVNNNIGGVYRDIKDYINAHKYYNESLRLAKKLGIKDLIAGVYLNKGITYQKEGKVNEALASYETSHDLFDKLNIPMGKASSLQSISSVYKDLRNWDKAEEAALSSIQIAKENGFNLIVASTNLTLSLIYISTNRFEKAQQAINVASTYSALVGDDEKIIHDCFYRQYQLDSKQKNYERALISLEKVYQLDKIHNEKYDSDKIKVLNEQNEKEKENISRKEREKTNQILFWASVLVSGLLIAVIVLLIKNVSKKAQTNKKLTELNHEISLQKENVDRVNHNLEEIIDERTLDLKIKNKKLSEYSSHLSHQIRGPVATLKGLMNLNKEGLIEKEEVILQMEKCVNDIDDKILRINDMLHDPQQNGFKNSITKTPDSTEIK